MKVLWESLGCIVEPSGLASELILKGREPLGNVLLVVAEQLVKFLLRTQNPVLDYVCVKLLGETVVLLEAAEAPIKTILFLI